MKAGWRILLYLRPYRERLIIACLCSVVVAGLTGTLAWLVEPVLKGIFIEKDQTLLMVLPLVVLGVAIAKGGFAYGQAYLMSYVGNRIVVDVRDQLYGQVLRLPLGFHITNSSGRILSRVIHDVNEMANCIPNVVKDLFQQGLTFLALLGVAFYQNWKLASVLVLVMPVSVYAIIRIGRRLRKFATRGLESMGDMATVIKEAVSGIRIVKGYGREYIEDQRFSRCNNSYMRANMKAAQLSALASPLMESIGVGGVALIIWYGGHLVITDQMAPGAFFSFLTAMVMAYGPIRKCSGANASIQRALAASTRVFEVIDLDTEMDRNQGRPDLKPISHSLVFENVSFYYEKSDKHALQNINLEVNWGEVVALVGRSGSGKSTLANLVPRFYDPTEGVICIDSQNIQKVSLSSLRGQIAIVSQDTVLFDDTIKANIAYGRLEATDKEIIQAAKAAHAWEFIEEMPTGIDTLIGENGVKLSGGQRQRLAIARAVLRDPPILILDEATSSLDTESERLVQAALADLMKDRTTLVIAHRLSTVQHADRIVVLQEGCIVEVGRHAELFSKNGLYKKLYQTQFHDVPVESMLT